MSIQPEVNGSPTKQSVLVDIQALLAVKESYEKDVQKLNNSRVDIQGRIDLCSQDLRSVQQRILSEEESWKQRKAREYSSLDGRLTQKEANLGALEKQLRSRENAIADVEAVKASYERKEYDLNSKSLQIEQIRMNLIEQKANSDNLLKTIGLERSAISQTLKDLERQKEAHRVEVGRVEELRAVLENRKADLDLREQTVGDALKGLGPKMKEVQDREEGIKSALEKIESDTASIKAREKSCEEMEKSLESRHKTQEELQAQLHAEEVKYRKKGLDLVAWQQTLDAREKELKKREKELVKVG